MPATNDNDLIDTAVPRLTSSSRGINRSKRRSTGVEERSRSTDWSKGGPQPGGPPTSSSFRLGILEARYPELPPPSLAVAFASSIGSRKGAVAECQGRDPADGRRSNGHPRRAPASVRAWAGQGYQRRRGEIRTQKNLSKKQTSTHQIVPPPLN